MDALSASPTDGLPAYAEGLSAYHRALADPLTRMVGSLAVRPGDTVLDVAAGDGFFSKLLGGRVGASGRVVAADICTAFLRRAQQSVREAAGDVVPVQADALRLPFATSCFDAVWCAQSFYSLPSAELALAEMVRVVKPGGLVAVLENDSLHHVLLPWPIELELNIHLAELATHRARSRRPNKYYVGRELIGLLRESRLQDVDESVWATSFKAPLGADERAYFSTHLMGLAERIRGRLRGRMADQFRELVDPAGGRFLLDEPDLSVVVIDRLVWGRKPPSTSP